jgi:hypothetical protein
MGLGAGYHILPYLERSDVSGILAVEFDMQMVKSIISSIDMRRLFLDRRFRLLVDPGEGEIRRFLLDNYLPAVSGDMQLLQLRARTTLDGTRFEAAFREIEATIDNLSEDYSVQSYFGKRWYKNSLRNLRIAEASSQTLKPVRTALITAAGPSLEAQLPEIDQRRASSTLIATDTSLPFLLRSGVTPDLVISIDCQHITYHHFLYDYPAEVPLVLDLASPRQLTGLTEKTLFFTSGHPFSRYVCSHWRRFPYIDTSGGNVSHAAVSLADALGARTIHLYGADYSFPRGKSYARGTYLYPFYHRLSSRTAPLETHFFRFLFRNPEVLKRRGSSGIRYTTAPMITYKERLEELSEKLSGSLHPEPGEGEVINARHPGTERDSGIVGTIFSAGSPDSSWKEFLHDYDRRLAELPKAAESLAEYRSRLDSEQLDVVTTLFPACATIRREYGNEAEGAIGATILNEAVEWSRRVIANQLASEE